MKITNPPRQDDGFGGQYQRIIVSYILYSSQNYSFYYTPFTKIEHNYNNDVNYINNLENLINLKKNIPNVKINEKYLYTLDHHKYFSVFENNIDFFCNTKYMDFIKKCFWDNKERDFFKNEKCNVAVHIRRDNQHDYGKAGLRTITPNSSYNQIMNIIRGKKNNLIFHIYSQGNIENFKDLEQNDVIFHLNENIENTFIGMVASEILVTSPSSFSYVAALISEGEIYYKNFWHKPRSKWNIF